MWFSSFCLYCSRGSFVFIVLRYACAHAATRSSVTCQLSVTSFVFVSFSEYFCTVAVLSWYGDYGAYVSAFLMVFLYLVTTLLIFDTSLCEISTQERRGRRQCVWSY